MFTGANFALFMIILAIVYLIGIIIYSCLKQKSIDDSYTRVGEESGGLDDYDDLSYTDS
jgi:hypothetical protein